MEERSSIRKCDRENDLITFLYGEVNEHEARDFERHLKTCSQCESELGAFKPIRESIIAWRDEALGRVCEPALTGAQVSVPRKQSAIAAMREFFNLSPLWLKGAVAFASILFCVFGSLVLARLLNQSDGRVASNEQKLYTKEELSKKIDEAVQAKERELLSGKNESAPDQRMIANNGSGSIQTAVAGPKRRSASPHRAKPSSRPLTRTEREQLATDLRLISGEDEITLDLIGDRMNQPD
jgi:hypothetical protein